MPDLRTRHPLRRALHDHLRRKRHADVPAAVVILGAGSIGAPKGTLTLGHFAARRWQQGEDGSPLAEIFVGGEGLALGAVGVLGTLLHEAAHAAAHTRGIKDTSRAGRYHNRRYKEVAEELGIQVTQTASIGWSDTTVPDATRAEYSPTLAALTEALTWYRQSEGALLPTAAGGENDSDSDEAGTDGSRKSNNNGVACTCGCGRRIRVAPSVLDAGPITCGVCGSGFEPPAEAEAEPQATAA